MCNNVLEDVSIFELFVCLIRFSTIDKTFHNHHFHFIVTTLSLHNQISTFTTTSLQHPKSLFPPSTRNKFH